MTTTISNQRTHQIGERLVISKLGQLGILATPSAGNAPAYHLLASDRSGHSLPLRVMAINRGSWQFNATMFLEIEQQGDCQVVKGEKKLRHPDLVCVFVLLKPDDGAEFYILPLKALQQYCRKGYLRDTKGELFPGGKRPRNPQSTHGAIRPCDLQEYRDWSLITKHFNLAAGLGEQAASPNGGPATPFGSLGVTQGPPSVS